jgi:hypothetical protein
MYYSNSEHFKSASGYEVDGIWYPRVTKIVEIKAKPALYRYYAEALDFATANAQTKKSAEEGSLIHEIAEKILLDEKPEINPLIKPSIDSFVKFLDEKNIQVDPEFVEKRIVNFNHRYAGTIDALALIDGKFGILDIKTSQAIYRDYNLQTSAYIEALQNEVPNLQTRWILRIDQIKTCNRCGATLRLKGGRNKIKNPRAPLLTCPDDSHDWGEFQGIIELKEFPFWKEDFEAFLGAKRLWEWENDYWLKQIGYL